LSGGLVFVYKRLVLLRRLPATTVGVLTYLEPASAVMFGWIFLNEVPGASTVVGGMLILVAGVIVVFATARAQGAIASVPR
jgi:drug/metabolite transporter (DMT)-like permease